MLERLRHIVTDEYVCVYVCVCVCPQGYLWKHTRDLYHIFDDFVHVAYGRGSVFLLQSDEISRGRGIVQYSI